MLMPRMRSRKSIPIDLITIPEQVTRCRILLGRRLHHLLPCPAWGGAAPRKAVLQIESGFLFLEAPVPSGWCRRLRAVRSKSGSGQTEVRLHYASRPDCFESGEIAPWFWLSISFWLRGGCSFCSDFMRFAEVSC